MKLLEEIHKRIGESYLILLPETIPFLAELMEGKSTDSGVRLPCYDLNTVVLIHVYTTVYSTSFENSPLMKMWHRHKVATVKSV